MAFVDEMLQRRLHPLELGDLAFDVTDTTHGVLCELAGIMTKKQGHQASEVVRGCKAATAAL